ncbi:MAG: NAD(P)-dependent dehydrogenase (short-subunit alcohol dehydrogenase family) [Oceanospirillaceae bacterium]|jgi:NAD(P)-dependent dehydrogenase (short-subunit alcohol dehydrogenase family)
MSCWPIDCFKNQTVLVIGGSSGIGAAIAAAFVEEGANVSLTGATLTEISASKEVLPKANASALDVRDNAAVIELISSFKQIHVLVNCAGVIRRHEELEPAVFDDVVDINLNGTMRVCVAAKEKLAQTNGSIINTASMLSFFGGGLVPAYSASKGGIAQLTKSLAIAYASDGIRVNAIAPGWIETPLTQELRDDVERNQSIMNRTALKRWGKPQDISGAVLFLASPIASYITGTILPIDGGYLVV